MSMANVKDLAITEIVDMTVFDLTTGAYWFNLEELQNWQLQQAESNSDVTGRNGRLITRLKRNKSVTISGTNGLISAGLLEAQTGSKFTSGTTTVKWTDYLVVGSDKAVTKYTAIGTAGSEILELYVKANDITIGTEYTQDFAVGAGKFTYTPGTKTITFNTSELADGTEIVVVYTRNISAVTLDNSDHALSGKGIAYVNALAEDTCGNVYRVQYYFPKINFSGEFSHELGGDQTTHNFSAVAEANDCLGGAFYTYTVFGANAEDVAVS